MSRKAREDRSTWKTPSMYVFNGDYGPFRAKEYDPVEQVLVLLHYGRIDGDEEGRHGMFSLAGTAQHLLLQHPPPHTSELPFSNGIIIVDVRSMFDKDGATEDEKNHGNNDPPEENGDETTEEATHDDALEDFLEKESEEIELTKGFGKSLFKLFQRMLLRKVVLAAHGNLCGVLLKLHKAVSDVDPDMVSELWLLRPELSTKFVNTHFVTSAHDNGSTTKKTKTKNTNGTRKKKQKDRTGKTTTPSVAQAVPLNLVVDDVSDSRVELLRHFFPDGPTTSSAAVQEQDAVASLLMTASLATTGGVDATATPLGEDDESHSKYCYEPDYFNAVGKSMYMSRMKVEMSYHTKQYERKCDDVTSALLELKVAPIPPPAPSRHVGPEEDGGNGRVGGLVLRGNRCLLVRSLEGAWDGMRIPMVERRHHEDPHAAAVRAVEETADVESDAVRTLETLLPVPCYGSRGAVVPVYALYAADPPPDGPLEDADMEDEDDYYDWYTYPNAAKRLAHDPSGLSALRIMSLSLVAAAKAGLVPSQWGGVFGQELRCK